MALSDHYHYQIIIIRQYIEDNSSISYDIAHLYQHQCNHNMYGLELYYFAKNYIYKFYT